MDTVQLSKLYMQRPVALAHLGLGAWYCQGTNTVDHQLQRAYGMEAKEHIIRVYPNWHENKDLLMEFNQSNTEK